MKCAVIEGYIGENPEAISERGPLHTAMEKPLEVSPEADAIDVAEGEVIESAGSDFALKMAIWLAEHQKITIWKMIHHFTEDENGEDLIVAIIYYIERTS